MIYAAPMTWHRMAAEAPSGRNVRLAMGGYQLINMNNTVNPTRGRGAVSMARALNHKAAAHVDALPGNEARLMRAQERHHVRDILRRGKAAQRVPVHRALPRILVG